MTNEPIHPEAPLEIRNACPKSWDELTGDKKKRYCSECCLHVYNGAELTQGEATALVSSASSRVCMRLQYDSHGALMFRDSKPAEIAITRAAQRPAARLARWALSAAAGLLAACHGSVTTPAASDPAACSSGGETPSKMGKVVSTDKVGDVATPMVRLGEAVAIPDPAHAPAPEAPLPPRDE